jgi:FtsP/CotA-like multicopper oxidase with cupredoxin domain
MYHSHFNEFQQIGSGMYGAIVVLEPGQTYDPETDRVLLFSDGGPTLNVIMGPFPPVLLNGQANPGEMSLNRGVTYRFRLINITAEGFVAASLLDGEAPVSWTTVAKDGADLPASARRPGPAVVAFAAGEIYDVEFTPERTGTLTLRFGPAPFPGSPPPVDVVVRVR